jgi:hypothetical protein
MSPFLKGAIAKFSESLGSGLAFGLVTVAALIVLKFVVPDQITRLTDVVDKCQPGDPAQCVVIAQCNDPDHGDEVVIGGQCIVQPSPAPR